MILERQASAGRSVRQIFTHFDRGGCGYINVAEMSEALTDLRLRLSAEETRSLLNLMAIDGGDRVSFGEFAVFVTDPHHEELQENVCRQLQEQLEAVGRRIVALNAAATPWRAPHYGGRGGGGGWGRGGDRGDGLTAEEFLEGLAALGLHLSAADSQRLLVRFDVHGDGRLSVPRFVSMVERSPHWAQGLRRLTLQEEADEEAESMLRTWRRTERWPRGCVRGAGEGGEEGMSVELVEMARYLGIRVSSDASELWVAREALRAPLPNGWSVIQGGDGRAFYRNDLTGQTRWDHPLDPYFRETYLRARFRAESTHPKLRQHPRP
ncbi:unnamed protein product, partial [Discosporangium mesarthrocarpum]